MRIARRVTRIKKLDSYAVQPPHHQDKDGDSDPNNDITDEGNDREESGPEKDEKCEGEEGDETEMELPETGDEIARIY